MRSTPASAGEAVLAAVQDAALGIVRPYDSERATRFETALEALSPNTRRVYGSALAARRLSQDSCRLPLLFGELLILQESGRAVIPCGRCRFRTAWSNFVPDNCVALTINSAAPITLWDGPLREAYPYPQEWVTPPFKVMAYSTREPSRRQAFPQSAWRLPDRNRPVPESSPPKSSARIPETRM